MPLTINDMADAFDLPPEDAIAFLKQKDPALTWTAKEFAAMSRQARDRAFTIARVMNADILQSVLDELVRAAETGQDYRDFKDNVEEMFQRKGWTPDDLPAWRLKLIFQNNMQTSMMAGRRIGQLEVADKRPYWKYIAIMDSNTTDQCRDRDGVIYPNNHAWWQDNYPPNHHGCRSRVTTLSAREMEREGLTVTQDESVEKLKPAKGFEGVPGKEFKPDQARYTPTLWELLSKALGGK